MTLEQLIARLREQINARIAAYNEHTRALNELRGVEAPDQPAIDARVAERAAVEAETCEACRHYLKIVHMERDAHVEPMADDLATLTLDLLVSDAGYQRHGTNLLLLFGDSEPPQPEPA